MNSSDDLTPNSLATLSVISAAIACFLLISLPVLSMAVRLALLILVVVTPPALVGLYSHAREEPWRTVVLRAILVLLASALASFAAVLIALACALNGSLGGT